MAKLHELLAVEGDLKSRAVAALQSLAGTFTNAVGKFNGTSRTYTPATDGGDRFQSEVKDVATTVKAELAEFEKTFSGWLNVVVQKEQTNGQTKAAVKIGDETILPELSAPALLNLEARLAQLRELYEAAPVLDAAEQWVIDPQTELYVTGEKVTYRTKKVPVRFVKYEATDKHPAQVDVLQEDVRDGTWVTVLKSGALSAVTKRKILSRLDELALAVKQARQRANDIDASNIRVAEAIFAYIHRE